MNRSCGGRLSPAARGARALIAKPLRFILGPWRWMLILYSYEEPDDLVIIVAFQDARSSSSATSS
jgi:hypothetical protein